MRYFILSMVLAATLAGQTPQDDKRLIFSTYQGGKVYDDARAVVVDAQGYIYVTGESESPDLEATDVGDKPLSSAVQTTYLTRYAPDGAKVEWRKRIGGSSNTVPHALALDSHGNIYLGGTTGARDLPLVNPVQSTQGGLNIGFLMQFDREGNLLFSTYFGGNRNEEVNAVAVDSQDNVYIAGRATSDNLPVKDAMQPHIAGGGQDGFIAKYTADHQLAYATYLGGTSGTDNIYGIAVGPDDSLYVTGESMSPGMATAGAYVEQAPSYSSYLAKIAADGTSIQYYTYLGWKGGYTKAQALAVDAQGRAYVSGYTSSKQMTTTENALQREYAGGFRDAFLIRMNPDGTTAEYLTYLGGSYNGKVDPDETAAAVKIDSHGFVYIAGETSSADFPGRRAVQGTFAGEHDAYVIRLDLEHQEIISSTFWGGAKQDRVLAIAVGPGEAVTVAGETFSTDLPLKKELQTTLASANDSFVTQMCDPWPFYYPAIAFNYVQGAELPQMLETTVYSGCTVRFDVTEVTVDQPWLTVSPDGTQLPLKLQLTVNPQDLAPGTYTAVIRVTTPDAFHNTLEIPVTFTISEPPPPEEEPTTQSGRVVLR